MKRCPECRRDYYDDTLLYCLDDGSRLLNGAFSIDEPATALLPESGGLAPGANVSEEPARTFDANDEAKPKPTDTPGVSGLHGHSMRNAVIAGVLGMAVLAVLGLGAHWFKKSDSAGEINSIAVLPFENAGGSADSEYLSDGISEALINSLSELQQLKVIARSTAFRYKGKEIDPKIVGRELNVGAVLMGRVRKVGDALNVQVDLVNAVTGTQLWGREYERQSADLLSIKQAIAREVTEKLRLRLSGNEQQKLVKRDTTNAEAYQFYLRGRFYWNRRTAENIRRALTEFQQAIDRDPDFALGYVGVADCYLILEQYAGTPGSETLPKAKAAVDRALQIDDTLAEAHTSLAAIHHSSWQWAEAEEEFRRAISLNPNYPTAHHWFANYYVTKGKPDEALREIARAQELDPLSPIIGTTMAAVQLQKNNTAAAIEECDKVIELNPGFASAYLYRGLAYFKQGRHDEAAADARKAVELSGRASYYLSSLGYFYAASGKRESALQILRELDEKYVRSEASGLHLAAVYAGFGDKDEAFAWLERDLQKGGGFELTTLAIKIELDGLRSDSRYVDLLWRIGLKP